MAKQLYTIDLASRSVAGILQRPGLPVLVLRVISALFSRCPARLLVGVGRGRLADAATARTRSDPRGDDSQKLLPWTERICYGMELDAKYWLVIQIRPAFYPCCPCPC